MKRKCSTPPTNLSWHVTHWLARTVVTTWSMIYDGILHATTTITTRKRTSKKSLWHLQPFHHVDFKNFMITCFWRAAQDEKTGRQWSEWWHKKQSCVESPARRRAQIVFNNCNHYRLTSVWTILFLHTLKMNAVIFKIHTASSHSFSVLHVHTYTWILQPAI